MTTASMSGSSSISCGERRRADPLRRAALEALRVDVGDGDEGGARLPEDRRQVRADGDVAEADDADPDGGSHGRDPNARIRQRQLALACRLHCEPLFPGSGLTRSRAPRCGSLSRSPRAGSGAARRPARPRTRSRRPAASPPRARRSRCGDRGGRSPGPSTRRRSAPDPRRARRPARWVASEPSSCRRWWPTAGARGAGRDGAVARSRRARPSPSPRSPAAARAHRPPPPRQRARASGACAMGASAGSAGSRPGCPRRGRRRRASRRPERAAVPRAGSARAGGRLQRDLVGCVRVGQEVDRPQPEVVEQVLPGISRR